MPKEIPLIKVVRLRALETPEHIAAQFLCVWRDVVIKYNFRDWKDFGEQVPTIIAELKLT